jgi:hypothetical protein
LAVQPFAVQRWPFNRSPFNRSPFTRSPFNRSTVQPFNRSTVQPFTVRPSTVRSTAFGVWRLAGHPSLLLTQQTETVRLLFRLSTPFCSRTVNAER